MRMLRLSPALTAFILALCVAVAASGAASTPDVSEADEIAELERLIQRKAQLIAAKRTAAGAPTATAAAAAVGAADYGTTAADPYRVTPPIPAQGGSSNYYYDDWLPLAFSKPLPLPLPAINENSAAASPSGDASAFAYRVSTLSLRLPNASPPGGGGSGAAARKRARKSASATDDALDSYWGADRRAPVGRGGYIDTIRQRKLNSALHFAVLTTPERALRFIELSSGEVLGCVTAGAASPEPVAVGTPTPPCNGPAAVHTAANAVLTHVVSSLDGTEPGLLATAAADGTIGVWTASAVPFFLPPPVTPAPAADANAPATPPPPGLVYRIKLVRESMIPSYRTGEHPPLYDAAAPAPSADAVAVAVSSPDDTSTQRVNAVLLFVRRRQAVLVAGYDNGWLRFFSRTGQLRSQYNTHNSTGVSGLAVVPAGTHVAFVTDAGVGVVRVSTRIPIPDTFCPFRPRVAGEVLRSVAFDSLTPSIVYATTSHGRLIAVSTRPVKHLLCSIRHDITVTLTPTALNVETVAGYIIVSSASHFYIYNSTDRGGEADLGFVLERSIRMESSLTAPPLSPIAVSALPDTGSTTGSGGVMSTLFKSSPLPSPALFIAVAQTEPATATSSGTGTGAGTGVLISYHCALPLEVGASAIAGFRAPMIAIGIVLVVIYQYYKTKRAKATGRGGSAGGLLSRLFPPDTDFSDPQIIHRIKALERSRRAGAGGGAGGHPPGPTDPMAAAAYAAAAKKRADSKFGRALAGVMDAPFNDDAVFASYPDSSPLSSAAAGLGGGKRRATARRIGIAKAKQLAGGTRYGNASAGVSAFSVPTAQSARRTANSAAASLGDLNRLAFDGRHTATSDGYFDPDDDDGDAPLPTDNAALDEFIRQERLSAALAKKVQRAAAGPASGVDRKSAQPATIREVTDGDGDDDDDDDG